MSKMKKVLATFLTAVFLTTTLTAGAFAAGMGHSQKDLKSMKGMKSTKKVAKKVVKKVVKKAPVKKAPIKKK